MNPPNDTWNEAGANSAVLTVRIIWGALLFGQVSLLALVAMPFDQAAERGAPADSVRQIFWINVVLLMVAVPLGYYLRAQCYKRHWQANAITARGYIMGNLLLLALLEAVSLFGLVAALVNGRLLPTILPPLAVVALLIWNYPTDAPLRPNPPPFVRPIPESFPNQGLTSHAARLSVATSANPGSIAVLQLRGAGLVELLGTLTGVQQWPLGRMRLVSFADLDEGLAVRLRDDWAQLMPHGGPRVVQRLVEILIDSGVQHEGAPPAAQQYPEADSALEADALATIARAASSAAIDLLLAQDRLWRDWLLAGPRRETVESILARSRDWDNLVIPPTVVVFGPPNVGKSTLSNVMLGHAASLVADLPGTTRDWVAGLAELKLSRDGLAGGDPDKGPPGGARGSGVAVRWLDTPGLHRGADAVERKAIELARQVIAGADVLISMCDPHTNWAPADSIERDPDLWVVNKIDLLSSPRPFGDGAAPEGPLGVSAARSDGIDTLRRRVLSVLRLDGVREARPWAFSQSLREALRRDEPDGLRTYVTE